MPNGLLRHSASIYKGLSSSATPPVPTLGTITVVSDTAFSVAYISLFPVEIWYSTDNVTYTKHGDDTATPYAMTGLTQGTLYYIKARAKNGSKYSAFGSVASATTFNTETVTYLTSTGITEQSAKEAINTLITGLKSNSFFNTKVKAAYIYYGDSETKNKFNLINPLDTNEAFRQSFSGSPIYDNDGIKFNGGYANSNFNPSTNLTANNTHISLLYVDQTDLTGLHGCRIDPGDITMFALSPINATKIAQSFQYSSGDGISASSNLGTKVGLILGSRIAANDHKVYFNGSLVGTSATTSGSLPNGNCYNGQLNYSTPYNDTKQIQFISYGEGFNPEQALVYSNLILQLQNNLNRRYYNLKIICDGDSLTKGNYVNPGEDYPTQMDALFDVHQNATEINVAVSGQTLAQMEADAATEVDVLVDLLSDRNIYLVWGGVNDLGLDLDLTKEECYDRLKTLCEGRITAGYEVFAMTMLPQSVAAYAARTAYETERQWINAKIRTDFPALGIGIIDIGADTTIGESGDQNNLTYYLSDKIHLNAAGEAIVAQLAYNEIM